jgi:release factor glutamine methyltransferase
MGTADNLAEPAAAGAAAERRGLRQLLQGGIDALRAHEPNAPLAAEVLLAHVLNRPRAALLTQDELPIGAAAAALYRALIARRIDGEPIAYLTGQREFWSLPLNVTPAVLIPRPETELLVERTLALLPISTAAAAGAAAGAVRVADLGTGSGAIVLALASERPGWLLTATDQSEAALTVARGNAARLNLGPIEFLTGDWLAPLNGRRFEAIVSNPPYIAGGDAALAALRHEPGEALSPGPSGLEALRLLISQAPPHLESGGWLLLEHGADQADAVAAALVAAGYARVRCHRDLAGRDRVTEGRWL